MSAGEGKSALFSTEGLVIREQTVGENDRAVTILTRDKGKIRAFANGAKRYKNHLFAGTLFLTYSRFTIARGKTGYKITQATVINSHFDVKNSLEAFALAGYFADAAGEMTGENENGEEVLKLLLNTLFVLEKGKIPLERARSVFELRLMSVSGYAPQILSCRDCGEYEKEMYFSPADGFLVCEGCKKEERGLLPLTAGVLTALRFIILSDGKKIFGFELPEDEQKLLSDLAGGFFSLHCGKRFETLDFYRETLRLSGNS